MEEADVPRDLQRHAPSGLVPTEDITYFLGRETLVVTPTPGMVGWREELFVLMARNAGRAAGFFRLPPDRVVELGVVVEL
jgi:KUP system potassium uptake protein